MKNPIYRLYQILPKEHIRSAYLLFGLIFIVSVFDAIGVASIFPFISLVSNPSDANEMTGIRVLQDLLDIDSSDTTILVIGILLVFILLLTMLLKVFMIYKQINFINSCEKSLSTKVLSAYISKSYEWHLNNNTGDIGKNVLSEVTLVITSGVLQVIYFLTQGLITFFIIAILFIVNPYLSALLCLVGLISYLILFFILKRDLNTLGEKRSEANKERYITVSEALNAFREVELNSLQEGYIKRFSKAAGNFATIQSKSNYIYFFPKYILEGLVFITIVVLITKLSNDGKPINDILPTLALFTFAGYKLLPAANQMYIALSMMKYRYST